MKSAALIVSVAFGVLMLGTEGVSAQSGTPTYEADPDVYKVIFEDQNFRVIQATWKKGMHDKPHSHPLPSVVYSLTDCTLKITEADGKSREAKAKAGDARAAPLVTQSHSAENIGPGDCSSLFVERK